MREIMVQARSSSLAGPRLPPPRGEGLDTCLQAHFAGIPANQSYCRSKPRSRIRVLLLAVSALRNQRAPGTCPLSAAEGGDGNTVRA